MHCFLNFPFRQAIKNFDERLKKTTFVPEKVLLGSRPHNDTMAVITKEKNTGNEVLRMEKQADKLIFDIKGEHIIVRSGAGEQFDKIINTKATGALGKTEYCQVDYTTKVKIIEESGEWTKIQVVEPEWLSSSHIGWIPTKNIIKTKENNVLAELDLSEYEIIKTKHYYYIKNFHILVKKRTLIRNICMNLPKDSEVNTVPWIAM